jgi:hypothetical protein
MLTGCGKRATDSQLRAARGFLPGPNESLAETWARAMGISCGQLRAELELRAAGLN